MTRFNAAFWRWFGDSKVVDENGEPLVVYHGSDEDFSSFRNTPTGIYFTSSIEEAGEYARAQIGREDDLDHVRVYPAYLRIRNPYTPEDTTDLLHFDAEYLGSRGYDGVIGSMLSNLEGGEVIYYAVFSPTQIKSIHNVGTWDPGEADIRRNPGTTKQPWEMTYRELRDTVTPSNAEELERARPILAKLFPEEMFISGDPWGIRRAVERGDELPRTPTVDLSVRHRACIERALRDGELVPRNVIAEYPDIRRNPGRPDIRRSYWITPRGELLEAEPHEHFGALLNNLAKFGFSQAEIDDEELGGENCLLLAMHRGAIRLIYDYVGRAHSSKTSWDAEVNTRHPRWRERLRNALMQLGIPRGTRVNIVDWGPDTCELAAPFTTNPRS